MTAVLNGVVLDLFTFENESCTSAVKSSYVDKVGIFAASISDDY